MTGLVVAPVVPPRLPAGPAVEHGTPSSPGGGRRVLQLPPLTTVRASGFVYGVAAVDGRGRIADHRVLAALGWRPGTRLDIRECGGLVLVTADRQGVFSVTGQGHVRLPAAVRHWCRLVSGDRVVLAADPVRARLVAHPPAALDAMIAQFHAGVLGGEAR